MMTPKKLPLFSTWQWLTMIGGLVVTGAGVTAWAFNTFEGKTDFERFVDRLDRRLDRIELKLDHVLGK